MYCGTCDVIEHRKTTDPITKKTIYVDTVVLVAQPCRLSYKSISSTDEGDAASVSQEIKLFLSPDVTIKSGSKIEVTQHGETKAYSKSGEAALYETHQEITLRLFDRWA